MFGERVVTRMEIERAQRLLAAVYDGLRDAPDCVLVEVVPQLEALADAWGLSEIVERCHSCWRTWDECEDGSC